MRLYQLLEHDNQEIDLPEHVGKAFSDLGGQQRGLPERTMMKAQTILGGGVLSFALEHVGDIIHRMTHHAHYGQFYPDLAREKTKKTLGVLTNGYGFMREHEENMQANIRYRTEKDPNFDEQEHRAKVEEVLKQYSTEHAKLVPYNALHRAAIRASILLGQKQIPQCIRMLQYIDTRAMDDEDFNKAAAEYELDDQGNLKPYSSQLPEHHPLKDI